MEPRGIPVISNGFLAPLARGCAAVACPAGGAIVHWTHDEKPSRQQAGRSFGCPAVGRLDAPAFRHGVPLGSAARALRGALPCAAGGRGARAVPAACARARLEGGARIAAHPPPGLRAARRRERHGAPRHRDRPAAARLGARLHRARGSVGGVARLARGARASAGCGAVGFHRAVPGIRRRAAGRLSAALLRGAALRQRARARPGQHRGHPAGVLRHRRGSRHGALMDLDARGLHRPACRGGRR